MLFFWWCNIVDNNCWDKFDCYWLQWTLDCFILCIWNMNIWYLNSGILNRRVVEKERKLFFIMNRIRESILDVKFCKIIKYHTCMSIVNNKNKNIRCHDKLFPFQQWLILALYIIMQYGLLCIYIRALNFITIATSPI